jgi:hypothetical protein
MLALLILLSIWLLLAEALALGLLMDGIQEAVGQVVFLLRLDMW